MSYIPELPEWLLNTFDARGYTDMSCICNWAHALFEGPDGMSVEVVMIEAPNSKPAYRILAIDQRNPAPLTQEAELLIAGAVNPRLARIKAEAAAELNKPYEIYLTKLVSTPDALVALLAALEAELNQ